MQDAHSYLTEIEALIRNHGLPKPFKSQKVSKLHHIFSYLKIIEESTSLGRHDSLEAANHPNNDCYAYNRRTDALEPSVVLNAEKIQLERSRLEWVQEEPDDPEDPLFVSIYQMPTTLLSLLSQTSSLCKQICSQSPNSPEFQRKCQIIEDRIFTWKAPESLTVKYTTKLTPDPDSPCSTDISAIAAHLVTATHQALIVHFQRQIRNTDPRVLQHYVMNVADHLLAQEKLKQALQILAAPFPWPGFIAGCESYDPVAREKIRSYMDRVRYYTVGNVLEAEKVIREVWRRQDLGRSDRGWEYVLKDWGMHIVLTRN